MVHPIAKILSEGGLPQELTVALQEAFDNKIAEAKTETEASIRQEFSSRYEHDRNNLVEAMDAMVTDVVTKHEEEKNVEVAKFKKARVKYLHAVKESRAKYNQKISESRQVERDVVAVKLSKEIVKLRDKKNSLNEQRLVLAEEVQLLKEALIVEHNQRLDKIEKFAGNAIERELKGLKEDQDNLVHTRVKLIKESRDRLRETQSRFVAEAARTVEKTVTKALANEMTQLHDDLERNRQNMFGRRVFEAMAAEYMGSYLNEGTEVRNLQSMLESQTAELKSAKEKLIEAQSVSQVAARKAKLAEDRAVRTKILGELLSNLRSEKRLVMEGMLETVKTDSLRTTFNKLLPVVLDDTARKTTTTKKALSETRVSAPAMTVITGDNRNANRFETEDDDAESTIDFADLRRRAGL